MLNKSTLSRLMNGRKNVLWGAGWDGAALLMNLISYGIYVDYFCDSDVDKQRIRLYNKKVLSPSELGGIKEECNVVVATRSRTFSREIAAQLKQMDEGVSARCIFMEDIKDHLHPLILEPIFLYRIILDSYKRKIIVYGSGRQAEEIRYVLSFLDVEVAYFVEDGDRKPSAGIAGREIKSVYDLIYENEDEILVIVTDEKRQSTARLNEIGLRERVSYNIYRDYRRELPRKNVLDPNLGFNFISDRKDYPGFNFWGSGDEKITVITLGGSTTDSRLYTFPSWPQLVYEKLKQKGYSVNVICGGCLGYKTSQELIKLIRDVIPMKPDLVIEYGGINDAALNWEKEVYKKHPFLHRYQIDFFEKAASLIKYEYNYLVMDHQFVLGTGDQKNSGEQYMSNIKMMDALCKACGIQFHSFLQPYLGLKQGRYSDEERELVLNTWIKEDFIGYINEFYDCLELGDADYISDERHLFDDCQDVYLDFCHVNEKGNEIIAERICDYIISLITR